MARVRVTRQAQADIESIVDYYIVDYYEEASPAFAQMFEEDLLEKVQRLADFPRMGRVVPEIGDASMREVLHRGYRVVYFVDGADEEVEVLTVFHSVRTFGGSTSEGS